MTILKQLRDAAMKCSDVEWREGLRRSADNIEHAITELHIEPTEDNMITLNGLWARATWALKNVPPEAEPTPPQTLEMEMRKAA